MLTLNREIIFKNVQKRSKNDRNAPEQLNFRPTFREIYLQEKQRPNIHICVPLYLKSDISLKKIADWAVEN